MHDSGNVNVSIKRRNSCLLNYNMLQAYFRFGNMNIRVKLYSGISIRVPFQSNERRCRRLLLQPARKEITGVYILKCY